ncbi:unannotated protein [freshwater metagenome]|uniref:Unannotated protein n=1 Tax=freshwater metagenome TaxID=449393 RepID=A0A6J6W4P1_9ZZZZ
MCVPEGPSGDGEADINGGVHHGLVALGQFVITQPGATARTVGGNAVVLDQQALVEDRFERPPHTFHVGGVHRAVGLLHIDPIAHARGHGFKGINVTFNRFTALGVEFSNAVFFNVLFAAKSEFLLNSEFNR